jgi:hypothetical protein
MKTAIKVVVASVVSVGLFGTIMGIAHLAGTVNLLTVGVASSFSCWYWSSMVSE